MCPNPLAALALPVFRTCVATTAGPLPKSEEEYEALALEWKGRLRELLEPCVLEIKRLDNDNEAYMKKLAQPALRGNTPAGTIFDPFRFLSQLNSIWNRTGSRLYDPSYTLPRER